MWRPRLVWQDAFGLRTGRMPRFVKQYVDVHALPLDGATAVAAADVRDGTFPGQNPRTDPQAYRWSRRRIRTPSSALTKRSVSLTMAGQGSVTLQVSR